jgi:hypothetical protein
MKRIATTLKTKSVQMCKPFESLECRICLQTIQWGQHYHDGGYGKRAHVYCVKEVCERDNRPQ